MPAFDYFNREIKVGDFVVPTNSSTFWSYGGMPKIVTRIGSDDRVQVNGGSYGIGKYFLIVNKEVQDAGIDTASLAEEYKNDMNDTPVVKKKKSPKFLLYRIAPYAKAGSDNDDQPRFMLIALDGDNNQENYNKIAKIVDSVQHGFGQYFDRRALGLKSCSFIYAGGVKSEEPKYYWQYSSINHAMSRKELLSHGHNLEQFIDKQIPEDSEAFKYLSNFVKY